MPHGMQLRATWREMTLAGVGEPGEIEEWLRRTGGVRREPMSVEDFIDYADWYRARFVPREIHAEVTELTETDDMFRLATTAGDVYTATHVVVAVGVTPFAYVPPQLAPLVGRGVEIAVEIGDHRRLAGKRVAIVGAGQTAVETAARALDAGADVEILARSRLLWFADREPHVARTGFREWLYRQAYPTVGYGPPLLNRIVLHPDLFALFPAQVRERLTRRLLRPGGSPWLREHVAHRARISEHVQVRSLSEKGQKLRLDVSDGSSRTVDVVLVAAGYRFDLDRLGFLHPNVRRKIRVVSGWPQLDRTFRSTHPRVYFVGYPAEGRFGASARFVLGVPFTAARVATAIDGR